MRIEEYTEYNLVGQREIITTPRDSSSGKSEKIDGETYMNLRLVAASQPAKRLFEHLAPRIWVASGGKTKPNKRFKPAVDAILADLIAAAETGAGGYAYRPFSTGSFTDAPIGYNAFIRAIRAMDSLGYVELALGSRCRVGRNVWEGKTTTLRASPSLLRIAADFGIVPADWRGHYAGTKEPIRVGRPIILKSRSIRTGRAKVGGAPVAVDYSHPLAAAHARQVDDINAFFSAQSIELPAPVGTMSPFAGFHRIFNDGGPLDYGYNKGGRLYPIGGCYQSIEKKMRAALMVNGESVIELDIGSSQARILLALLGNRIGPDVDPYDIGIDRWAVKTWFTQTMGHSRLHRGWSPENRKEYTKRNPGRDLSVDHPIRSVQAKVIARWPELAAWESCSHRWGDLQYIEAQAVISAVHELAMTHGMPAYPVHDSIIVPAPQEALARRVLSDRFCEQVGVEPMICRK